MELRRDPITQSWVNVEDVELAPLPGGACPLCPGQESQCPQTLYRYPYGGPGWQVRVTPHLWPLYRIEGNLQRVAEGVYDRMRSLGAHEIVVEHPDHHLRLSQQTEENVAQVLRAYRARVEDLKKDRRFRYVTVLRNQGELAGQDLEHPHSQITATPFIPRRVGYELRSSLRYYALKERCLICDMARQELAEEARIVEWRDPFVAFCPFASRVPYETWALSLRHHCAFEQDLASWDDQLRFAGLLRSILRRLEAVAPAYHLALHTSPNERSGDWQSLAEDYHWHFEVLPIIPSKARSYSLKEVYYNSLRPEVAAEGLRKARV